MYWVCHTKCVDVNDKFHTKCEMCVLFRPISLSNPCLNSNGSIWIVLIRNIVRRFQYYSPRNSAQSLLGYHVNIIIINLSHEIIFLTEQSAYPKTGYVTTSNFFGKSSWNSFAPYWYSPKHRIRILEALEPHRNSWFSRPKVFRTENSPEG